MEYTVKAKPGSKKGPLVEDDGQGGLVVYISERPIEGKANEAVVELLASHFGVAKSRVTILRGHTSRIKLVRVE